MPWLGSARLGSARPAQVVEIRASAGGEEASLFAAEVLAMVRALSTRHGWTARLAAIAETGIGGLRDAVLNVQGEESSGAWLAREES